MELSRSLVPRAVGETVEDPEDADPPPTCVAAGGISRRTFYNSYVDEQEAFFDVYRQVSDFLLGAKSEAADRAAVQRRLGRPRRAEPRRASRQLRR
jgi:hypothetical protein